MSDAQSAVRAQRAASIIRGLASAGRAIGTVAGSDPDRVASVSLAFELLTLSADLVERYASGGLAPERAVEALRRLALDPPPEVDAEASADAALAALGVERAR